MSNPQIAQWFAAVDQDRSGQISANELRSALMSSNGRLFSEACCRLMIGMFDRTNTGQIDIHAFEQLYNYVNQWLSAFKSYDRNGSGFIDNNEFMQALSVMGYRFSPEFVAMLATKFGEPGQGLPVDGFITACILIQKFTEGFRQRDTQQQGIITVRYEDFLSMIFQAWA